MDEVGILNRSWNDTDSSIISHAEEQRDADAHQAEQKNSWEEREKIYRSGGTGWWSPEDQSKVTWQGEALPEQGPCVSMHVKPA